MDLRERYNEPGTFAASQFTELERHTLQAAFTEEVNLGANEILENVEEGDIADLDAISDKALELSLIEEGDSVMLTSEEIDDVRKTLIKFANATVETVQGKLQQNERHELYNADGIPHRIRLGRAALKLQQEFAAQNTGTRAVEEEHRIKDTEDVEKFLASFPGLAAQSENPN